VRRAGRDASRPTARHHPTNEANSRQHQTNSTVTSLVRPIFRVTLASGFRLTLAAPLQV
jgi:hypothetical protein